MSRSRRRLLLYGVLAVAGAAGPGVSAASASSARLGVVIRHGDTICAYLQAPPPNAGGQLDIIVPGAVQTAAMASLAGAGDACHDQITPPMQAFRLAVRSGTIRPNVASIAILGEGTLSQAGPAFEWRSGSAPLTFSSCTSADGVHLGASQQGRRIWHAYLYVGQDLVPDCTQAEARP